LSKTPLADWTNVRMALVSGRPISFISRLYEPRYVERPVAELAEDQAQAPVVDTGAVEESKRDAGIAAGVPGRRTAGMLGGMSKNSAMMAPAAPPPAPVDLLRTTSTISAPAAARELGELFEYRMPAAVTIRKNESAMLPFLQDKITGRRLLIYSDQSSAHPLNAAEITNSAGKTLDGGPVTVFDAGSYAGEALMETLKAGDKRLLSYAVDLGTRITAQFDSRADLVREIHMKRGILTTRTAAVETKTYTIRNVDPKTKTLIVEHPARAGYTLLERKPLEKTATAYRFEVKLPPGATEKFPVAEERVYETSFAVANLTPDVLVTYVQNKNLSDAARKQLTDIAERKRRIAGADAEIRRVQAQLATMERDQERIRQNIASLNRVSGQQEQVQKYARQLADQESQIAALRDRQSELERNRAALQSELDSLIEKMDF
jgi:hypothetical protein